MARPITVTLPHKLGQAEARRRLEEGFGAVEQQMTNSLFGALSFQKKWEGDQLQFEGGALGQKICGRLDVLPDTVVIQVDLPELLAAIADRITSGLKKETQKLLEKR